MEFVLQYQLPLWVTSVIVVLYVLALLYFHPSTPAWVKAIMAIPPLGLVVTYIMFSFLEIPLEIRSFFGRNALNIFFAWHIAALWLTRKLHLGRK